jgi:hypothetical protein
VVLDKESHCDIQDMYLQLARLVLHSTCSTLPVGPPSAVVLVLLEILLDIPKLDPAGGRLSPGCSPVILLREPLEEEYAIGARVAERPGRSRDEPVSKV